VAEVPVEPLLAQHSDECGQQRHQKARIKEVQGRNDLCGGTVPRWGSGGIFTGNNGSIEGEENRSKVGFGPLAGIRPEVRLDVDDEGGADRGEQTGLRKWSTLYSDER
jgi:hypothetical protein